MNYTVKRYTSGMLSPLESLEEERTVIASTPLEAVTKSGLASEVPPEQLPLRVLTGSRGRVFNLSEYDAIVIATTSEAQEREAKRAVHRWDAQFKA